MKNNNIVPETMAALVLHGHGGMDQMSYVEQWPTPVAGDEDVIIKVAACGLNNTDVNTRTGWYSKTISDATIEDLDSDGTEDDATWGGGSITFPMIQGADVCGEVVAVGSMVSRDLIGKRVLIETWVRDWNDPENITKTGGYLGSEINGGFAQYTCVNFRQAHPINCELSDAELATFPTSYLTAEHMLDRAWVGKDDIVAITGASGGVGSALIQLANRRGAKTIAFTSTGKMDELKSIGAFAVIDRDSPNLAKALAKTTGYKEVSVVADVVGGDRCVEYIDLLTRGGRFVCSGGIAGPIINLDLRTMYLRDLTLLGSTVTSTHAFPNLVSYIEKGEIKPILANQYPLSKFHDAQKEFLEKKHIGNIVVVP